jgi:Spy/CpxP family protein refolding chaperone
MIRIAIAAMLAVMAGAAHAQPDQPYAGQQNRAIKALSAEQIADLRAARGMGLALAAELNGYPGPAHVLEHAEALTLTDEQRTRTRDLFEAMKTEARAIGERLIAQEARLDRAFADNAIDEKRLADLSAEIGATQGALRAAHLKYHLSQAELLTPPQRHRYAELRGYVASAPGAPPGQHSGHHAGHHR